MTRITKIVIANGLPIIEGKSEAWIHLLITGGWINWREQQRSLKRFVWPQYLVKPQYIERYFEENQTAYQNAENFTFSANF